MCSSPANTKKTPAVPPEQPYMKRVSVITDWQSRYSATAKISSTARSDGRSATNWQSSHSGGAISDDKENRLFGLSTTNSSLTTPIYRL
jgi:hypothetical protein